jgi:hypothetical protein
MENYMSYGNGTIGIKDKDIYQNWNSKFIAYLKQEGFKTWGRKGYYCGNIIYVNLNSKRYAFSVPGVKITEPLAYKYISIKDFKKIYKIYKKYEEHNISNK